MPDPIKSEQSERGGVTVPEIQWVDETSDIANGPSSRQDKFVPFIVETGTSRPTSLQARKLIHSNASRHRPKGDQSKPKSSATKAAGGQRLVWRLGTGDEKVPRKPAKPRQPKKERPVKLGSPVLVSARIDPFQATHVQSNGETDMLLHFWVQYTTSLNQLPVAAEFFPFLSSSPAFAYAIFCMSAFSYYNFKAGSVKKAFIPMLRYKSEALKEVNKSLQHKDQQYIGPTIAAIALLALSEFASENYAVFKTHIDGLEAMVQTRGGVDQLETLTRELVMWVDMTASAVFQTPPRYRMTPQTTSSKTFIETHLSSIITPELKDQITDVYTEILELSQELDEIATTEGKRQDDSFYEKCGDLEAHTTSLIKDIELKGPFEGRDVLMAFAYAAVLYQYTIIRPASSNPGSVRYQFTIRLRSLLHTTDVVKIALKFPDLTLWVLSLGGLTNVPDDIEWYEDISRSVCMAMPILDPVMVAVKARAFGWPIKAKVVDCYDFWVKVCEKFGDWKSHTGEK